MFSGVIRQDMDLFYTLLLLLKSTQILLIKYTDVCKSDEVVHILAGPFITVHLSQSKQGLV